MKISTNIKDKSREAQESKFEAIKHLVYKTFKSWLERFLQQPGIDEDISIYLQRGSRPIMDVFPLRFRTLPELNLHPLDLNLWYKELFFRKPGEDNCHVSWLEL
ncbi:uncharacterized protein PGTG_19102 [Puccinia graminis f. sp. tritici CRL 75-36-700-3]|uniref:Uncharacterized protein n=1 Tax=Puccinia graminis f. sp. tritici (strain CRL 75-36-700-3 / race SCCL) TaxID=418459 RepID=E3L9Y4_PUCGT|nr:uncharacterized protein PGTG_19102 [Puccinia graminis f. sp. tritici CRL 75-36-700-3]EFP93369.1 hypothetical protein PGTG_19102 [Puccinia graminis f. sp. tritici CRL 75-36-700-3]